MLLAIRVFFFLLRSPRGSWHKPAGRLNAGATGGGLDALAGALKQSGGVENYVGGRSTVLAASGIANAQSGRISS